jgi:hypothetical protein
MGNSTCLLAMQLWLHDEVPGVVPVNGVGGTLVSGQINVFAGAWKSGA